jgi:hypothetical protein
MKRVLRVLIDNCVPRPLSRFLTSMYLVTEARKRGWARLQNGDLLSAGEDAGFDILVTTDKNMRYQQNLTGRTIAVVLLEQQEWELIEAYIERVVAAINAATPGSFAFVEIPLPPKKPYVQ